MSVVGGYISELDEEATQAHLRIENGMLVLPAAHDLVWRGLEGCVKRNEDGAMLRV